MDRNITMSVGSLDSKSFACGSLFGMMVALQITTALTTLAGYIAGVLLEYCWLGYLLDRWLEFSLKE